jgi:hypothetical protein
LTDKRFTGWSKPHGRNKSMEAREVKAKARSFVLVLAVLALVGCGSSETKVSADVVVQDALAAQADVSSSHVEITLTASAEGTMSGSSLNATVDAAANGDIDWANKKMKSHVGMTIGYGSISFQMTADAYAVDNVAYTQWTAMGNTDNWTKSVMPVDFWFTQDNSQFINSLLESIEAESLSNEKVGGVNCYVLQLTPDIAAIQQMLSQQSSTEEEIPDIASLIQNLSIKVWVAKDTSRVTKIEIVLSAHLTAEALGHTATGDVLDISLTLTMEASNFNKLVSIELPAEAQNAEEGGSILPFDMFGGFSF